MPYTETAILAVFAMVIGLVIFGGTTLAAFRGGASAEARHHPTAATAAITVHSEARSEPGQPI
jgi:hypothetical protein